MKTFKVTIYPTTNWTIEVEAENEKEAKEKALATEGPSEAGYFGHESDWNPEIWEWPNIGPNGQVDIEEV